MTVDPTIAASSRLPRVPQGEDYLPYDDGEPMESNEHRTQMNLLITTLNAWWSDRPDVFVGGNMAVYFSDLQVKKNDFRAPDFFAVQDTVRRSRKSWVVWGEGGRTPDVVVELLSERTRREDEGPRKRIYERNLRVPDYFMYDLEEPRLVGFQLVRGAYQALASDARGLMPAASVGLRLGLWKGAVDTVEATWLRWYTPDGNLIPTDAERAEAEAQRAEAEAQRVQDLARKLAEYERRFGRLRDD